MNLTAVPMLQVDPEHQTALQKIKDGLKDAGVDDVATDDEGNFEPHPETRIGCELVHGTVNAATLGGNEPGDGGDPGMVYGNTGGGVSSYYERMKDRIPNVRLTETTIKSET